MVTCTMYKLLIYQGVFKDYPLFSKSVSKNSICNAYEETNNFGLLDQIANFFIYQQILVLIVGFGYK